MAKFKKYSLNELIEKCSNQIDGIYAIHSELKMPLDNDAKRTVEQFQQISEELFRLQQLEK